MTLECLRDYRPYFPVASLHTEYQKVVVIKNIKWIEDVLIKHSYFALLGRKALPKVVKYEVVLIDATEVPIAPKKSKE